MENKKNKQANLEKSKSMFLTIGLITAFSLLTFAFNRQSEYVADVWGGTTVDPIEIGPPVTIPKPPKPEPTEPKAKKIITDLIQIVEKDTPIDTFDIVFPGPDKNIIIEEIPEPEDKTFIYVKKMPIFHGDLRKHIATHVVYPALAKENNIQGTVYLRFVVTKTGAVGKVEILGGGSDILLQEAAIDVIKKLPDFEPGEQNGEKVKVWLSVPISFKLAKFLFEVLKNNM